MKRQVFSYILAAACAVAAFSCSRASEFDLIDPCQERDVVLTASIDGTLDTRGVTVSGEAVTCKWREEDKVMLVYENEVISELSVASISGSKAILTGKVKGAYPKDTRMMLYYGTTVQDYYAQNGTLESTASRAYLCSPVTIAKQDNKTLSLAAVSFKHQQAYFELSFRFGPDLIPVKTLTVTGTYGASEPVKLVQNRGIAVSDTTYFSAANPFTVRTSSPDGATTIYFALSDESPAGSAVSYNFEVVGINGLTGDPGHAFTAHPKEMISHIENGRYYSGEWILDKMEPVVVDPVANTLLYDGNPHELIVAGAVKHGYRDEGAEGASMWYLETAEADPKPALDDPRWSLDIPSETEPGTYKVWFKVESGDYFLTPDFEDDDYVLALIDKRTTVPTPPTAISDLKYTGSSQALVNPGIIPEGPGATDMVMKYLVSATDMTLDEADAATGWSSDIPRGLAAGDYYVWWKVDGNTYYYDVPVAAVGKITIAQAEAVTANPVVIENLIYNGDLQQLVLPADASEGCKVYYYVIESDVNRSVIEALAEDEWSLEVPKRRNAGTYYVWTRIVEEGDSHNYVDEPGISAAAVVIEIKKIPVTLTPPTALTGLVYNGASQKLVETASGTEHPDGAVTYTDENGNPASALEGNEINATLKYMVTESATYPSDWSSAAVYPAYPEAKNAGNYYIWLKVEGGRNFEDNTLFTSVPVSIAVAPITTVAPVLAASRDYTGTSSNLIATRATARYATATGTADATATAENPYAARIMYICKTDDSTPAENDANWTTGLIPQTNANTYTVWYKVIGSRNFEALAPTRVGTVVINKVDPTLTRQPNGSASRDYNGSVQVLLTGNATVSGGTVAGYQIADTQPGVDDGTWVTYGNIKGQNAGTYNIWTKIIGDANHNTIVWETPKQVVINPIDPTLSAQPTGPASLPYNGSDQALLTGNATVSGGTVAGYQIADTQPGVDEGTWVAYGNVKGKELGSYTIWTKIAGDANHNTIVYATPKSVEIVKATPSAPVVSPTSLTFPASEMCTVPKTVTVTRVGDGAITAVSSDESAVSVSVEDNVITVRRRSLMGGTFTITVSVGEGTNYEAAADQTVTVSLADIQLIPGVFTIGVGKTVKFTRGNLRATGTTASTPTSGWTWSLSPCQYSYVSDDGANQFVSKTGGTISVDGPVDLFGWVGASSSWTGVRQYGNTSSENVDAVDGFGNVDGEALKSDWGNTVSGGYRTLTIEEWRYLFETRPNADQKWASVKVNGRSGMLILPDIFTDPKTNTSTHEANTDGSFVPGEGWNPHPSLYLTNGDWEAMEAAGAVFLPNTAFREWWNDDLSIVNDMCGYYWSSTSSGAISAYYVYFNTRAAIFASASRSQGHAVRLVKDN